MSSVTYSKEAPGAGGETQALAGPRAFVYGSQVISSALSRVSAAVLAIGGGAFLFAADALLPALVPGFPSTAAWLGQLVGASWLGGRR